MRCSLRYGPLVPSSLREALRSPGEPLGAEVRSAFGARAEQEGTETLPAREPAKSLRLGPVDDAAERYADGAESAALHRQPSAHTFDAVDFRRVRVHDDAHADEAVRSIDARACTVGDHVLFAQGQYRPHTAEGRGLLAHELAHVAQADAIVRRKPDPKDKPSPKRTAVLKHEEFQKDVATIIKQGLQLEPADTSPTNHDALLRNACEWIESGRATLTILTPTHDFNTRDPEPDPAKKRRAYFDRQVKYPVIGGDYDEHPSATDQDHIEYAPPNWLGGMSNNMYDMLGPLPPHEIRTNLIHEVQHSADRSSGSGSLPGRVPGPGKSDYERLQSAHAFNMYQTEFRSYWLESPDDPGSQWGSSAQPAENKKVVSRPGTSVVESTHFANRRQEKIFWHIAKGYEHLNVLEKYWMDETYRGMVDGYSRPAGVNLVNSTRIDDLIMAIVACKLLDPESDPKVQKVLAAADALDANDRSFLAAAGADQFWKQVYMHMGNEPIAKLRARLKP
jgi:hypothetical protein